MFAGHGILAKSWFVALFRASQRAVQQVTEVGLDDLELTLGYGDGCRKIIDNAGTGERGCSHWPHAGGVLPASSWKRGLPGYCRAFVSSPCNRIGPVTGVQIRFPPHCTARQASVRARSRGARDRAG